MVAPVLTKTISKFIDREKKLSQGAFGLKAKMIHRNAVKLLDKLLIKSKDADNLVRTEFTAMADKIEELEEQIKTLNTSLANLKRSNSQKKKVKGMVGKGKKLLESGLKEKLGGSV